MRETIGYVAASAIDSILYGLFLVFIACLCRVLFRSSRLAVPATFVLAGAGALVVEVPKLLEPGREIAVVAVFLATYLVLLYRVGLLATTAACCVTMLLIALPVSSDMAAPTTTNSILVLCLVLGCAFFSFHATLAGRPVFRVDF
jgi:hypothetical protein